MIDLKDSSKSDDHKHSEYPVGCELKGSENTYDNFKIFINESILTHIDEYLSSDTNNELGGVLVGDVCVNAENKRFILIENFIIAKHTNSSLSRLTFTHETWNFINESLERQFPGKKILGWFHSHPGHTVFLSNFDIFIQENFFNIDYMVAYVFDPTIRDRAFFTWKEKKIVRSKGFYTYDTKKKINEENFYEVQDNLQAAETNYDNRKNNVNTNLKTNIVLGIAILNLLLLILFIYNYYQLERKILLIENYATALSEMEIDIRQMKEKLETINPSSENEKDLSLLQDTLKTEYIVKNGDTLEKIAYEIYNNSRRTDILIKENRLQSKWDIKPGQVLQIPKLSE